MNFYRSLIAVLLIGLGTSAFAQTPYVLAALSNTSSDNSSALQTAINSAQILGVPVYIGGPGRYYFTHGVTNDISKTSVYCQGAIFDFTGMSGSGSAAITLMTSDISGSQMQANNVHPFSNCDLRGPDASSGVDGFHFTPTMIGFAPTIYGISFDHISGSGFTNFFKVGAGTVGTTWNDPTYGGQGSGTFLDVIAGDNNGENYYINHGILIGLVSCFNDELSNGSNVDIFATATSCNEYNHVLSGGSPPGTGSSKMTVHYDGHIENSNQNLSDYRFNMTNGGFDFTHGEWTENSPNHTFVYDNMAANNESIGFRIGDVEFDSSSGAFQPLGYTWADGPGPFRVTGAAALGNTPISLFAIGNNKIPQYTFASDPTNQWVISGTSNYSTARMPSGASGSLQLVANAGTSTATIKTPCAPGNLGAAEAFVYTSGVSASGGNWRFALQYLSISGAVLNSFEYSSAPVTWDFPVFAVANATPITQPAPPGTAFCSLFVSVSSGSGVDALWFALPILISQ